ncbi:respiratory chain complex I subunit 1 family protein [Methanobacterium ferruginis]|uniref:respiratory chain complex I subunit 1 family protein n=1 Tax=Methanobacterium ferruginis TaxID=710191 RepID=UPI0025725A3A|nr:NADH-quinone oxidoreductase subunit H [Methanobacterium ferruginis]MCC7551151.1 NADH-quinone oxidoreductase subunit H [Methanobacterium sp.]BDZ68480.1 NADH-ubiquinone oxidoreductase [Methanobacterium ferruginis]
MNLMANILLNVLIAFLVGSVLFGLQRKIMARIQMRPGPPVIQHLLHTLKFFIKESSFPKTAAMPFYIAITAMLCVIWVSAVIVGPVTEGSLLLIFAIYAIHKIVEHNAGSSSGSPYGKLSCVRAVFSASAEVPLFAVLIIIYFKTGTMVISNIINFQATNGPLIYSIPLAAAMFFVLILSKAPYSPFAITKGKDIISGYETEHFGLLRGYLMMSESIAWYMLLWVFLTVFIGGLSPLWYLVGMVCLSVIVAFINATTPILSPNHSIMMQVSFAIVGIVGSLVLLLY